MFECCNEWTNRRARMKVSAVQSLSILAFISFAFILQSCFFVKEEKKPEKKSTISPKAEIAMSDEYIRSKAGDILAFMPQGWYLVDTEGKTSSDVIAVAVNSEYTLSMVVQQLRTNDLVHQTVSREGVIGLARVAIERRQRKTSNSVKIIGSVSKVEVNGKQFGLYDFTGENGDTTEAHRSRSIVIISSIDNYYEVSLVPTKVTTTPLPSENDVRKIFHSMLVSLQF